MKELRYIITIEIISLFGLDVFGQEKIDLGDKLENGKIQSINRKISIYDGVPDAVEMDAKKGNGLAILQDFEFTSGIIEVQLKGENNPGRSFIGIAFNISNDTTYEAIYFRPFNFVADKQIQKDHMMQYVSHPEFTWDRLRRERPGDFEAEIEDPLHPDNWFKATIEITDEEVIVYVNDGSAPTLKVKRLVAPKSNKIGLWAGESSSGRFKNLALTVVE